MNEHIFAEVTKYIGYAPSHINLVKIDESRFALFFRNGANDGRLCFQVYELNHGVVDMVYASHLTTQGVAYISATATKEKLCVAYQHDEDMLGFVQYISLNDYNNSRRGRLAGPHDKVDNLSICTFQNELFIAYRFKNELGETGGAIESERGGTNSFLISTNPLEINLNYYKNRLYVFYRNGHTGHGEYMMTIPKGHSMSRDCSTFDIASVAFIDSVTTEKGIVIAYRDDAGYGKVMRINEHGASPPIIFHKGAIRNSSIERINEDDVLICFGDNVAGKTYRTMIDLERGQIIDLQKISDRERWYISSISIGDKTVQAFKNGQMEANANGIIETKHWAA